LVLSSKLFKGIRNELPPFFIDLQSQTFSLDWLSWNKSSVVYYSNSIDVSLQLAQTFIGQSK